MATEIGSPPIHGPLPRFPLSVELPSEDLNAPLLRQRAKAERDSIEVGWACALRSRRRGIHQRHRTLPSVGGPRWMARRATGVVRLRRPSKCFRQAHPSASRDVRSGSPTSVVRVGAFQPVAPGLESSYAGGAWRAGIAGSEKKA